MKIGTKPLLRANLDQSKKNILEKIEKDIQSIRDYASNYYRDRKSVKELGTKVVKAGMPHNFISILGGRGSGKTSLMLTLLKELEADKSSGPNVILPIIDPDKFSLEKDALGWVIFSFQEVLNKYLNDHRLYCDKGETKTVEDSFKLLKRRYIQSRHYYRSSINGLTEGISEYNRQNEEIIFADMELYDVFRKFIDELVLLIRQNNDNKQPLFFLTFDDIDFNPRYAPKILTTILNFLNQVPIIVIALGNYGTFTENLIIDFWNQEKIPEVFTKDDILYRKTLLEARYTRSEEFLNKLFPPIYRNNLGDLPLNERLRFTPFSEKEDQSGKVIPTMGDILDRFKIELNNGEILTLKNLMYRPVIDSRRFIDGYIKNLKQISPELREYVERYRNGSPSEELAFYANVLPRCPRGLMNLYYSLFNELELNKENSGDSAIVFQSYAEFYDKICDQTINFDKYNAAIKDNYNKLIKLYFYFIESIPDLKMYFDQFNIADVIKFEIDTKKVIIDYQHIQILARDNFRFSQYNISKKIIMRYKNHDLNPTQSAFIQFFHDLTKLILPSNNIIIIKNGVGLADIILYKNSWMQINMVNFELFHDYYVFMEMFKRSLPIIEQPSVLQKIQNLKSALYLILKRINERTQVLNGKAKNNFNLIKIPKWTDFATINKTIDLEKELPDITIKPMNQATNNDVYSYNIIEFIYNCNFELVIANNNFTAEPLDEGLEQIKKIYRNPNIGLRENIEIIAYYLDQICKHYDKAQSKPDINLDQYVQKTIKDIQVIVEKIREAQNELERVKNVTLNKKDINTYYKSIGKILDIEGSDLHD